MPEESDNVVIQHILESADNTITAYKVYSAFPEAWQSLVRHAFEQVEEQFRSRTDADELDIDNQFQTQDVRHVDAVSFTIRRRSWPLRTRVGFITEYTPAQALSVGLHTEEPVDPELDPIVNALNSHYGKKDAKHYEYWPWYQWQKHPYDNLFEAAAIKELSAQSPQDGQFVPAARWLHQKLTAILNVVDQPLRDLGRGG